MRKIMRSVGFCILILFPYVGFAQGMLEPMGPIAADMKTHLIKVTLLTMIAVLPVLIGVPILLLKYRRGKGGTYRPDFNESSKLEWFIWGVPIFIFIFLAAWTFQEVRKLDPYRPLGDDPLEVQAIGLNWKWLFIYPEQNIASVNELVIPAGRPVELSMTSDTVMLSLLMPQLAGQIYSMPGMVTKLNFQSDNLGETKGANVQYSGDGFSDQHFEVNSVSEEDFDDWAKGAANAFDLDAIAYVELAKPGTADDAAQALGLSDSRMNLADTNIFMQVVERYHSDQPIDANQQPGTSDYQGSNPNE